VKYAVSAIASRRSTAIASSLAGSGTPSRFDVWVQARAELVLDGKRNLVAIRESWTFDPEYSAFGLA
jgi:hypothetical protein